MVTVGLDDAQRNVQTLGLFDRLIAGDDAAVAVDQDSATWTILAERVVERRATTLGAAVGVAWVGRESSETTKNGSRRRFMSGTSAERQLLGFEGVASA
jgi:hypothetical protein